MKNDYDAKDDDLTDDYYESDGLRWISIVVVILVIFGFFSLAWYAYRTNTEGTKEGDMTLVEADTTPMKEKPQNPGGMEFEHTDKDVYNRIVAKGGKDDNSEDNVEKLLPEAEEPIVEKTTPKHQEGIQTWINDKIHPDSDKPLTKAEIAEKKSHEEQVRDMSQNANEPQKSDTETFVKQDDDKTAEDKKPAPEQALEKPEAPVKKSETSAPQEVGEVPVATTTTTVEEKKVIEKPAPAKTEPKFLPKETPKAEVKKPAAGNADPIVAEADKYSAPPTPPATTSTAPAALGKAAAAKGGSASAQLASLRTRAEAETTLSRIRAKHADLLAGKNFSIVEADVPGKGAYFRIRVMADKATLTQLCSGLKARGQDCIPVQ